MTCRLYSTAAIALAAAAGLALTAAADSGAIGAPGDDIRIAQVAGYDPMRRSAPSLAPSGPQPEGNPEFGGLPDGPGAEDTYYMCSACHSIALVKQQRLTDARWDYLWNWMIEEQGMADAGEEYRQTILGYLKQHYSSERQPGDPLPDAEGQADTEPPSGG